MCGPQRSGQSRVGTGCIWTSVLASGWSNAAQARHFTPWGFSLLICSPGMSATSSWEDMNATMRVRCPPW